LKLLLELMQGLINEDRDRGRIAMEGLGILNRKTPEIDAIWDHLLHINAAMLKDEPFTIDQRHVRGIASAGFDPRNPMFQSLRKVGIPGIMVTFNRMSFGVASLTSRLESTANWQAIARELWAGEPSQTRLGKKEQAWLKKAHPDLVPPLAGE
jgi:hypothetical protein